MKNINEFITEAKQESLTTMYFPSMSAFCLFAGEVQGQLSDGYWENSRPASHWRWITNMEYVVDESHDAGYEGPQHRINNYSLKWMIQDLNRWLNNQDKDYQWTTRFLNLGKAGTVLNKNKIKELIDNNDIFYMIEYLPEEPITYNEFEASLVDWKKQYWEKAKGTLNSAFFKAFYKTNYTLRDLKADLSDLEDSMNTKLF